MPADFGDDAGEYIVRMLTNLGQQVESHLEQSIERRAWKASASAQADALAQAQYNSQAAQAVEEALEEAPQAQAQDGSVTVDVELPLPASENVSFKEMATTFESHINQFLDDANKSGAIAFAANEEENSLVLSFREHDRDLAAEAVSYTKEAFATEEALALEAAEKEEALGILEAKDMEHSIDVSDLGLSETELNGVVNDIRASLNNTSLSGLASVAIDANDHLKFSLFTDDATLAQDGLGELRWAPLDAPGAREVANRLIVQASPIKQNFLLSVLCEEESLTQDLQVPRGADEIATEALKKTIASLDNAGLSPDESVVVTDAAGKISGVQLKFFDTEKLTRAIDSIEIANENETKTRASNISYQRLNKQSKETIRELTDPLAHAEVAAADISRGIAPLPAVKPPVPTLNVPALDIAQVKR